MRAFAWLSALSLAASAPAAAAPVRVASLNLCTDEYLLMLGRSEQIMSVTHLARQAAETPLWRRARRYRANDGSLLSVAAMRPDLVLTSGGGGRDRIGVARRLGIRLLDVPPPTSLDDVARSVDRVAAALGQAERGRAWRARFARLRAAAPRLGADTIWLGGGGLSLPPAGLGAAWMRLAGLRQRPLAGDRASLETLIARPPAILLRSAYRQDQFSSGRLWLSHPAVRRVRAGRTLSTDGRYWTCLGPLMLFEMERLQRLAS